MSDTDLDPSEGFSVELLVRPPDGCPVRTTDRPVTEIRVRRSGQAVDCEVDVRAEGEIRSVSPDHRRKTGDCLCPRILDRTTGEQLRLEPDDDALRIMAVVGGYDEMMATIAALESVSPRVELVEYARIDGPRTVKADIDALAPPHREALEIALDAGYYDPTSDTTMDELAARVGLSTQEIATRLEAAERGLFDTLSFSSLHEE
ncbi:MAG: helix-turn-helix domain-containing protein [Halodesulfurarchaeum sp.]